MPRDVQIVGWIGLCQLGEVVLDTSVPELEESAVEVAAHLAASDPRSLYSFGDFWISF